MTDYDAYKRVLNYKLTNIKLGHTFINRFKAYTIDDIYEASFGGLDVINHFNIYDNWYLPFDRVSCINIVEADGYDDDIFGTVIFSNNPEHKLTSPLDFVCISSLFGKSTGSVQVYATEDVTDTFINQLHVSKTDCISMVMKSSKYSLVLLLKTFTRADNGCTISAEHLRKINADGAIANELREYIDMFAHLVAASFSYFTKLIVDTKLFVVEERLAFKRKDGSIRVDKGGKSIYHVIDIKTLRAKYIGHNTDQVAAGTRAPHERRRHTRTFRSDYYTHRKGETIIIDACWIGPTETYDNSNQRLYKVLLHVG